jgi:hypothetical protein
MIIGEYTFVARGSAPEVSVLAHSTGTCRAPCCPGQPSALQFGQLYATHLNPDNRYARGTALAPNLVDAIPLLDSPPGGVES